jgi:hypothetical protein
MVLSLAADIHIRLVVWSPVSLFSPVFAVKPSSSFLSPHRQFCVRLSTDLVKPPCQRARHSFSLFRLYKPIHSFPLSLLQRQAAPYLQVVQYAVQNVHKVSLFFVICLGVSDSLVCAPERQNQYLIIDYFFQRILRPSNRILEQEQSHHFMPTRPGKILMAVDTRLFV